MAPARAPDGWATFNFDAENTRHNRHETLLSAATIGGLVEKWSVPMDPGVTSTPAVVDGVVYACDHERTLYALDVTTGDRIWEASDDMRATRCSSPLVAGDAVYSVRGSRVTARSRRDGSTLWSTPVHSHPETLIDSSPVLARDRIIIGVASYEMIGMKSELSFRGAVVALDRSSGEIVWTFYTTDDGAPDASSGAGIAVWSSAAVDESRGMLFIGTGQAYEAPAGPLSDSIIALDIHAGQLIWFHQFHTDDIYTETAGCGGQQSPCELAIGAAPNLFTAAGRDLVGAGSKGGVYKALDRDSGQMVWQRELGPGGPVGGVMAVAAVGHGQIYVSQNTSRVASTLFALAADDGRELWQTTLSAPSWGAVTLANGLLYFPTVDGIAHIVDAADGRELRTLNLDYQAAGGFSIVDGMLFAPSGYTGMFETLRLGKLTAFGLP